MPRSVSNYLLDKLSLNDIDEWFDAKNCLLIKHKEITMSCLTIELLSMSLLRTD